ncbi:MAG: hypothetical protein BWK79_09440 [Beggiatoa sp. IS2]|nr:MAG: hypothetical protein BWK79_09440 [Beggiatoa sp. IS2]
MISWVFSVSSSYAASLLELYNLAELNDPQLKIAESERLATLEKKPQARALLLPQVTANANVNENWRTEDVFLDHGQSVENTAVGYQLSLTYALYHRDLRILSKQADSQMGETEANYESVRQSLMERLSVRYFKVLAAEDNLQFTKGAKEAFQRQLDQAKQRFEVGLIAATDVQEAQSGYDLAVADEIQAQNELDNAREALREITGNYYDTLASLREDVTLVAPEPADIHIWTRIALEKNPQIIANQYAVETARQEIDRQRAVYQPTVDVVGTHSYQDVIRGEFSAGTSPMNSSIGLQLNYNLYDGGTRSSRIREAQQRHNQSLDNLEKQRRAVQLQTHNAYLNVMANISRVKALKQALLSTKTALEAVQRGFEVGTRTSVDVLNAQRDLLQAQRNYASARYDYVLNILRLQQAVGLLGLEDLYRINALLRTPGAEPALPAKTVKNKGK